VKKLVAILEDNAERIFEMRKCISGLLPDAKQIYFDDAAAMMNWLSDHLGEVVLISLDHDLPVDGDHGTGRQVADFLAGLAPTCPAIVHTSNEFFGPGMMSVLNDAGWPVARVYPHSDIDWIAAGWSDQIRKYLRSGMIF
jgi:hypothetical protein